MTEGELGIGSGLAEELDVIRTPEGRRRDRLNKASTCDDGSDHFMTRTDDSPEMVFYRAVLAHERGER